VKWLAAALSPAILACSSPGAVPIDGAVDVSVDAGLTWDTVEQISNDGQVIVEKVSYFSGPLRIYARLCRPADDARHPVVVYNHGGFYGLAGDQLVGRCASSAQQGSVWISSSYRGEDGSDGAVELCNGEVDDVIRALEITLAQSYADPAHVFMWGASHGGCITLRAIERGAPVTVAADLFGATDHAEIDRYWHTDPGMFGEFIARLEAAAGGTPEQVPDAYLARSPLYFVGDIPSTLPLFVAHGALDTLLPYTEACALAAAPIGLESYHLDDTLQPTTAPAGCNPAITWKATPRPAGTWPAQRYLVIYDGLGHDNQTSAAANMIEDALSFALAKM
jgi:acetyl esterase/lipase